MVKGTEFLPVSRDEMIDRGWYYYDFLVVTADGYIVWRCWPSRTGTMPRHSAPWASPATAC